MIRRALAADLAVVMLTAAALIAAPAIVDAAPNHPTIDADDGTFGDVTVAIVTNTDLPFARATCEQGGVIVYEEFASVEYGSVLGGIAVFQLGPTALWTGGDADCEASVGYLRQHGKTLWRAVAVDTFHVVDG